MSKMRHREVRYPAQGHSWGRVVVGLQPGSEPLSNTATPPLCAAVELGDDCGFGLLGFKELFLMPERPNWNLLTEASGSKISLQSRLSDC